MFPGSWHGSRGCTLDRAEIDVFDHRERHLIIWLFVTHPDQLTGPTCVIELQTVSQLNAAEMINISNTLTIEC